MENVKLKVIRKLKILETMPVQLHRRGLGLEHPSSYHVFKRYMLYSAILESLGTLCCCKRLLSSDGILTFSIGGFYSVSPQQFVRNWSPIFEGYLNEVVGPQFSPPINFSLVPVDFVASVQSADLLASGKLDFICEISL